MSISLPKLKAMLRFFATKTDPRLLGKVKLMKLFYFSDFGHVKQYATPITNDTYKKLDHGPVPTTILNLVSTVETEIENAILADTISIEINGNQKRVTTTREYDEVDEKYFTPSELKTMEKVCKRFYDKTGKFIEDKSHEEAAWLGTKLLGDISYSLAASDPDSLVDKEEIELLSKVMA